MSSCQRFTRVNLWCLRPSEWSTGWQRARYHLAGTDCSCSCQQPWSFLFLVQTPHTHTHKHTHTQRLPINVCEGCQHPLVELQNIISKIIESLFACAVSQHFLIEALRKQLNQHYWISIGHLGSWSAECKWSWLCVLVGHNNEMCLSWKYLHLVIVREWISWINQSTEPD